MSALWAIDENAARLRPMAVARIDAVLAVEAAAYAFPWSRGNFIDSLAADYPAQVLESEQGELLGYFVATVGVDELHLLNLTVAPPVQGRGHARTLHDALLAVGAAHRARDLWLEVRAGNERARSMYAHLGYAAVGVRKGYYPAPGGRRENAIVMSLKLAAPDAEARDALG